MPYDILHILGTARPEGASIANFVSGLANSLDRGKYRMHAWFLGEDGPLAADLRAVGVGVRNVHFGGIRRDRAGAIRFWRALREEKFAIIHQHAGGKSVAGVARWASRAGLVRHLHGRINEDSGSRQLARISWCADEVIANSRAVADVVSGCRPHIVYPGFRIPDRGVGVAAARRNTTRVVGTACRLVPIKGVVHLLRALALLRPRFPDVRLEVAGSGPQQKELEDEVDSLGLSDQVAFLGWQTDVAGLLTRWDVFALPSLEEGFGIAALEAMAAGLPVVASAVGGLPELVEDGLTGWLVPPGDSVALADRLTALLLDSGQRFVMGIAGQDRARKCFSLDRMAACVSKVYDDLLNASATAERSIVGRVLTIPTGGSSSSETAGRLAPWGAGRT